MLLILYGLRGYIWFLWKAYINIIYSKYISNLKSIKVFISYNQNTKLKNIYVQNTYSFEKKLKYLKGLNKIIILYLVYNKHNLSKPISHNASLEKNNRSWLRAITPYNLTFYQYLPYNQNLISRKTVNSYITVLGRNFCANMKYYANELTNIANFIDDLLFLFFLFENVPLII